MDTQEKQMLLSAELKDNTLIVSPLSHPNVKRYDLVRPAPNASRQLLTRKEEKLRFVKEYVKYKPFLITGCKYENKKRKLMRHAALIEISKKMNIPGFGPREAYSKIRNIKSTYFQELKKIRTEAAHGRKYESNLIWFKVLDNAYKALKAEDLEVSESNKAERNLIEINEEISTNEDNGQSEMFFKEENMISEENDGLYLEEEHNVTDSEISENAFGVGPSKHVNDIFPIGNVKHEFDIFGESIAAQLKNMHLTDALEAQMFIQNYLSNLRLQSLRQQLMED